MNVLSGRFRAGARLINSMRRFRARDLIAGSLIKHPGGTIAPCGGYVAGKEKLVKPAAARLFAPGLGMDCGSTPGDIMRTFFHGLFLSPQMVGEAIKGSFLIVEVMEMKGYKVQPLPRVPRHDTVQAVQLGIHECLLALCEAVQRGSPVGSFTKPIAGATPGYASEVWPSLALFVTMQCLILATVLFFEIMFGD